MYLCHVYRIVKKKPTYFTEKQITNKNVKCSSVCIVIYLYVCEIIVI